ncbi:MAG TPA: exodeoxyribonuclease I, partial [Halieaceae bacterium]|nr:exodeoxyribonuclease I [Halieaceae bacterium]
SMVTPEVAARIGLDGARCRRHLAALRDWHQADAQGMIEKLQAVYAGREFAPVTDPDRMLYSGGFFSDGDRRAMDRVRAASPDALAGESFVFEDARLPEMLFRYRARNFPHTLSASERAQWDEFRLQRIAEPDAASALGMEAYQELVDALLQEERPARERAVLEALLEYGDALLA